MKLNELEYKALNIMDEISTVEVAFWAETNSIHIFDTQQAVEPQYDFVSKRYVLNDSFYPMAEVLAIKNFFPTYATIQQWIDSIEWKFYSSKQTIKTYKKGNMQVLPLAIVADKSQEQLISQNLYPRYIYKLK